MTYLQIVRALARISGTADPRSIETLQGATGRIRLLADMVESAWTEIQNTYNAWTFLTVEFPEGTALQPNVAAYTGEVLLPGQLPPSSEADEERPPSNWAEWIPGTAPGTIPLTLWEADGDRSDERRVTFSPSYPDFRARYQVGANVSRTGRPQIFSIDVQDRLVFWPTPDQEYRLAGTYRRSAQSLSADDELPIGIAPQYHRTLVHAAKILLDHSDEADGNVLLADIELPMTFQASLASLRRRYLSGGSGSLSRGTAVGQGSSFRPVAPVNVIVNN